MKEINFFIPISYYKKYKPETARKKVKEKVFSLVKERKNPDEILKFLNLSNKDIVKYTFESCSFVIALVDKKTLIEVCWCPEMIHSWEEKLNPLFQYETI